MINYKNFEYYYFVDHNDKEEDDIDNAINIDTQLKFLNNFELDVKYSNPALLQKVPRCPRIKIILPSFTYDELLQCSYT
jgi:hypothetical protein